MTAKKTVLTPPPKTQITDLVKIALDEDTGLRGDITTNSIFAPDITGEAIIRSRENGVLAGLPFAKMAFKHFDENSQIKCHKSDGQELKKGDKIATINATVQAILTGERTALNFLGHLSGIATLTNKYVKAINGTSASITDTRKTLPGLRSAEKYAVRAGGGVNHRFRLDDAILIKDNHIAFAGGIGPAIEKAKAASGHMIKIEVEVDTLPQLKECLEHEVDAVLLDNMSLEQLNEAVNLINGRIISEASGGISLDTVADVAATGIDIISIGALTHSAPSLDLGLDIDISSS